METTKATQTKCEVMNHTGGDCKNNAFTADETYPSRYDPTNPHRTAYGPNICKRHHSQLHSHEVRRAARA